MDIAQGRSARHLGSDARVPTELDDGEQFAVVEDIEIELFRIGVGIVYTNP